MRRPALALVRVVAMLAAITVAAHAEPPAPADVALAETLFAEGKKLMASGRFAEACPKLAESQRLDPGGGTLLNLASCHESEGKTASAWAEFSEVASQAQQKGRTDIAKNAKRRADALVPLLSKLVIEMGTAATPAPGLEVRRDGTVIQPASFGVEMPLDPGPHTVSASARGHATWTSTVTLGDKGDKKVVRIPALVAEPSPPPAASSSSPAPVVAPPTSSAAPLPPEAPSRAPAIVATGVGVVGLSLAVVFGLQSRAKEDSASRACPDQACADKGAVDDSKAGVRAANYANVAGVVGLAGAGVAAYLWLRPQRSSTGYVAPVVGNGLAGVVAGRAF